MWNKKANPLSNDKLRFLSEANTYLRGYRILDFPDSSVGKESACNAEDASLIPGLEDLLEKG